ncbi:hypothetical protein, partial [Mesorhizobium japonicum]|uniref:hypothetical protein n=1 Tax=Mesorhizobium japonicum TaxID=2066070 RepID=UPI003B5BC719
MYFVDGNTLQAQDITIHGDAQLSGPRAQGIMFTHTNQVTATSSLDIVGNGGVFGVNFAGAALTLDSPHTQVTGQGS